MKHFLPVILLLSGCATTQATSDRVVPKYQGKPVSLVFQRWGVPDRSVKADGGTIYQWRAEDRRGVCRLEAHGADPLRGDGGQTLIGVHFTGEDSTCSSWMRMLK